MESNLPQSGADVGGVIDDNNDSIPSGTICSKRLLVAHSGLL